MNRHASIPKGLCPLAQDWSEPGWRGATLGHRFQLTINPNGVVALGVVDGTQPCWGWGRMVDRFSQGSSCLATLGFKPESRWGSPFNQRGGLGKAHQLFGEQLGNLLEELNQQLVA